MPPTRALLIDLAREHGFSSVRFATLGPTPRIDAYEQWIARGEHGHMDYLARGIGDRQDPRQRLAGARSVMVMGVEHHHARPPDPGGLTGAVARYAWGRDYHNLMGKRLRKLRKRLSAEGVASWGGVDTAPVLERAWAEASGLGFIGKNCMTILPARTSWILLAVLFVDVEIAPDKPLRDHCGRCRRCLDGCPTGAFAGPRHLDARRCIAYWTIESRDLAPRALRPGFGRWALGCDVCQEVCPHNAAAPPSPEDDLAPRNAWLDLPALLATPDQELADRFIGTPLRRPGGVGLKRNALVVLGNLPGEQAAQAARVGLEHPSPVVRGAAVWALARHGAPLPAADPSPLVEDELRAAREGEVPPLT